jgi:pimeloyl-ACP methyl ester carboxylesterase
MKPTRIVILIIALLLIAVSWWQVAAAPRGLVVRQLSRDGVPMLYLAPAGAHEAPGVLLAHGFAGSRQLMLGYGYTLAHAGYAVMLWDFAGHGANPQPLAPDSLQAGVDAAYGAMIEQPEVDPSRLALLGHSMGSGAVMIAAIRDPERYAATIAVSPASADVTPDAPSNLLLQAGSLEAGFVGNARMLLAEAGGERGGFAEGRARQLTVIPFAEHISILFRGESHRAALDWLANAFGEPRVTAYVDRRIIWYGLSLLGWLLALIALAPVLRPAVPEQAPGSRWLSWVALPVAALIASGMLALLNPGVALARFGGLMVGGAVGLWFLVAGLIWLPSIRSLRRPALADLGWGVGVFAVLTLACGVMASYVWLPWWLNLPRLARWPLLALACLPWFLAAGMAQRGAGAGVRVLWWLVQSLAVTGGLFLALMLMPSLSFLVLLLPLMPVLLGIVAVAGAASGRAWAYGLGGALFIGWIIAAVFPLAG